MLGGEGKDELLLPALLPALPHGAPGTTEVL